MEMKAYIVSNTEKGTDNIDGIYYLITEKGEVLASHWCSCKYFAKGDLYEHRPERIKEYAERFGHCECLFLGEDNMTAKKLIKLNRKFFKEHSENKE